MTEKERALQPDRVFYYHERKAGGKRADTAALFRGGDFLFGGVARCSRKDTYVRKEGNRIALERAKKACGRGWVLLNVLGIPHYPMKNGLIDFPELGRMLIEKRRKEDAMLKRLEQAKTYIYNGNMLGRSKKPVIVGGAFTESANSSITYRAPQHATPTGQ